MLESLHSQATDSSMGDDFWFRVTVIGCGALSVGLLTWILFAKAN
jgi:hypothetical protein